MKTIFSSILLVLFISLGGCSGQYTVHPQDKSDTLSVSQRVRQAIDQANAVLAASYKTLVNAYNAGVYSWEEGREIYNKINEADAMIVKAESLYEAGSILEAQNEVERLQTVLQLIEASLIKAKQKGY